MPLETFNAFKFKTFKEPGWNTINTVCTHGLYSLKINNISQILLQD